MVIRLMEERVEAQSGGNNKNMRCLGLPERCVQRVVTTRFQNNSVG